MRKSIPIILLTTLAVALSPLAANACACGCGVFDVGTGAMLPTGPGGSVYFEYDTMNQNKNRSGTHGAPSEDNDDKDIRSNFFAVGGQYMFDRKWGLQVHIPYTKRHFVTEDAGIPETFDNSAVGDIRISGIYSGFSPDMSTGVTFGLKLPTGDYKDANFDRDTSIGSGSTDLTLGAYHSGVVSGKSGLNWFANGLLDTPLATRRNYRPGTEVDGIAGIYRHTRVGKTMVVPLAQLIAAYRVRDSGAAADPDNSGYSRLLFAPGVEVHFSSLKVFGEVGVPIYQKINGNQLAARALVKITVSHDF